MLERIFEAINHVLEIIWNFILKIFFKIVPPKFIEWHHQGIAQSKIIIGKAKILILSSDPRILIKQIKNSSLKDYIEIVKIPLTQAKRFLKWAKEFDIKRAGTVPEILDQIVDTVWRFISYPFRKIYTFVNGLSTTNTILFFIVVGVTGVAGYFLTINSKFIYRQFHPVEDVTQIEQQERPEYYKKNERQVSFYGIDIPVYIEGAAAIKSLKLDVTIQTSNRFSRNFLETKKVLVLDRLNSGIEEIIPSFPLTEEGKNILKNKIQNEINRLINDVEMKGNVEQIYLDEVIAN